MKPPSAISSFGGKKEFCELDLTGPGHSLLSKQGIHNMVHTNYHQNFCDSHESSTNKTSNPAPFSLVPSPLVLGNTLVTPHQCSLSASHLQGLDSTVACSPGQIGTVALAVIHSTTAPKVQHSGASASGTEIR